MELEQGEELGAKKSKVRVTAAAASEPAEEVCDGRLVSFRASRLDSLPPVSLRALSEVCTGVCGPAVGRCSRLQWE